MKKTIYTLLLCSIIFSLSIMALSPVQAEITINGESSKEQTVKFTPEITIGNDFIAGKTQGVSGNTIGKYIKAIYTYAIGAVGILAALFVVIGGVQWLTSAGSPEKISEAKARILASLSGLVLALSSFLLLNYINPDLVTFRSIETKLNLSEEEITKTTDDAKIECTTSNPGTCYHYDANSGCRLQENIECEAQCVTKNWTEEGSGLIGVDKDCSDSYSYPRFEPTN